MSSDDHLKEQGGGTAAMRLRQGGTARHRFVRLDRPTGPDSPEPERSPSRAGGRLEDFLLRAVNFVVALIALLILLPAIVIISVLIKLDTPGPAVYRQLRIGLDRRGRMDTRDRTGRRVNDLGGRPFMIYKFRTMRVDAELDSGPVWASKDDERATRLGRWLRKTRMDEIPQFWNVLKGDMGVVGPRPERPNFVLELQKEIDGYRIRNRVKPGITGWAQVNLGSDRSVDDVREKVGYDLEYVRRRSLWFDVLIMLKTLPVMFERDKTYGPDKEE
jgi:lipopolysaccharide/colanic/teichoic acid biosynthesis glycosyltransferase